MRNIFKVIMLSVFMSSALLTSTCFAKGAEKTAFINESISYSFIQIADFAELKTISVKKNLYTLTLKNIPKTVSYISDRPERITGQMNVIQFYKNWGKNNSNSFAKDSPNVSVFGMQKFDQQKNKDKDKNQLFLMKLSHPVYSIHTNQVTYQASFITKASVGTVGTLITLQHVMVFLDDWCPGCCC